MPLADLPKIDAVLVTHDHFSSIGARFGPFDMSFVKVGAYGPGAPWLDIHMSAEDAVRGISAELGL